VEAVSDGPGKGSLFTVSFPAISARAPVGGQHQAVAPVPSRRIVIVEDNADSREMLRALLELQGHDVEDAPDGLTGVALVLRLHPDVAFVDVGLPGIDGYEVARRIRADRAGRAVCLVVLSGYGLPEDQERSRRAGFDAHLVKPFQPAKVSEILRSIREQA
jgi:CheY-like chemotaxis protein